MVLLFVFVSVFNLQTAGGYYCLCLFQYLIDKLQDGIKGSEHKLAALQLMLYLVYKRPPWTHKLAETSIFNVIIKCLKVSLSIFL